MNEWGKTKRDIKKKIDENERKNEKERKAVLKEGQSPQKGGKVANVLLCAAVPLVFIGFPLTLVGAFTENAQTITDDVILVSGVASMTIGTICASAAHVVNYFSTPKFDTKQTSNEVEDVPEIETDTSRNATSHTDERSK